VSESDDKRSHPVHGCFLLLSFCNPYWILLLLLLSFFNAIHADMASHRSPSGDLRLIDLMMNFGSEDAAVVAMMQA
jgi:hypothetical protein